MKHESDEKSAPKERLFEIFITRSLKIKNGQCS